MVGKDPLGNYLQGKMPDKCAASSDSHDLPDVRVYSADELRSMDTTQLVSHAAHLQQIYGQAKNDLKFLKWEYQEFQESFVYFSRAAKLAHKLSASDVDTVAELAINEIPQYFNCNFAALFFFDSESETFQMYRSTGTAPENKTLHLEQDSSHFLIRLFFTQSEPFVAEYVDSHNILVTDTKEKLTAVVPEQWYHTLGKKAIIFPLHVQPPDSRQPLLLGGLIMGDSQRELVSKDAEVAVFFGDLLSSSLYNARLVKRLNELTIIDSLTNIYNRRHLINQLGAAMIQSRRHGHCLSIAMLDIDHFKRINDTYGHMVGDQVLRELAAILKSSIRSEVDIPARYGGEEFIIIMPFIDLDHGVMAAERLRKLIKKHSFEWDGLELEVTCSIGVAEYVRNESLERFIDRADVALYQAKADGRDQVAAAVQPPGE